MLDGLKNLFSRRQTLDDLPLDELRKEKIRLDQEEKKMMLRLDQLEEEKKKVFMQGRNEPSERKKMVLARKFKELDAQAKSMERNMQYFSKQLRIINGFMNLKENQRILKESGISSVIARMDLQELQIYVDQASIDGTFQIEKLQEVLGTLEEGGSLAGDIPEDKDVMEVFRLMESAGATEDAAEIDAMLGQANLSLAKQEPSEEE